MIRLFRAITNPISKYMAKRARISYINANIQPAQSNARLVRHFFTTFAEKVERQYPHRPDIHVIAVSALKVLNAEYWGDEPEQLLEDWGRAIAVGNERGIYSRPQMDALEKMLEKWADGDGVRMEFPYFIMLRGSDGSEEWDLDPERFATEGDARETAGELFNWMWKKWTGRI